MLIEIMHFEEQEIKDWGAWKIAQRWEHLLCSFYEGQKSQHPWDGWRPAKGLQLQLQRDDTHFWSLHGHTVVYIHSCIIHTLKSKPKNGIFLCNEFIVSCNFQRLGNHSHQNFYMNIHSANNSYTTKISKQKVILTCSDIFIHKEKWGIGFIVWMSHETTLIERNLGSVCTLV